MARHFRLFFILFFSAGVIIADAPVQSITNQQAHTSHDTAAAYSALKLFLEDQQHLTTIRRIKMVLSFSGISDQSAKLIDEIADSSEKAVDDLEKLSTAKPAVTFKIFSDEEIATATINSLRLTTAKEFLFDSDGFEKNLLISQLKVLRLISHLAEQLKAREPNKKRQLWLSQLSIQYEDYYQQVHASLFLPADNKLAYLK